MAAAIVQVATSIRMTFSLITLSFNARLAFLQVPRVLIQVRADIVVPPAILARLEIATICAKNLKFRHLAAPADDHASNCMDMQILI
jgi:hypothetical protein